MVEEAGVLLKLYDGLYLGLTIIGGCSLQASFGHKAAIQRHRLVSCIPPDPPNETSSHDDMWKN